MTSLPLHYKFLFGLLNSRMRGSLIRHRKVRRLLFQCVYRQTTDSLFLFPGYHPGHRYGCSISCHVRPNYGINFIRMRNLNLAFLFVKEAFFMLFSSVLNQCKRILSCCVFPFDDHCSRRVRRTGTDLRCTRARHRAQ